MLVGKEYAEQSISLVNYHFRLQSGRNLFKVHTHRLRMGMHGYLYNS